MLVWLTVTVGATENKMVLSDGFGISYAMDAGDMPVTVAYAQQSTGAVQTPCVRYGCKICDCW